jgi:cysteine desulfurase/selenocysteine lyase
VPRAVIDAVDYYETQLHSNVHRGVHTLSQLATDAFEAARERVRRYINATSTREIIFVRGTTEAINLIAQVWGGVTLQAGDEIIVSALEHHANLVPWQMACAARGATLRIAPIDADGQLQFDQFLAMLGPRTRMVAMTHVSNVMGSVLPVQAICAAARERGIATLIDGAQAVAHDTVDVRALGTGGIPGESDLQSPDGRHDVVVAGAAQQLAAGAVCHDTAAGAVCQHHSTHEA